MSIERQSMGGGKQEEFEQREEAIRAPFPTPAHETATPVVEEEVNEIEAIRERLAQHTLEAQNLAPEEYLHEAKEVLERVDMDVLKGILAEYRKKSGVEEDDFLVGKDSISILPGGGGGEFDDGRISIGAGFLYPEHLSPNGRTRADFRNQMLGILVHEETHAASFNYTAPPTERNGGLGVSLKSLFRRAPLVTNKSGFRCTAYKRGSYDQTNFRNFNEGVTDKIAEEVQDEYLKRTGDREYFSNLGQPVTYIEGYLGPRSMVSSFIEILAAAEEVPSEQVWNALKQGYMSGLDLRETSLSRAFDEVFFPEAMEKMGSNVVDEQDLPHAELQERAEHIEVSPEGMEKMKQAYTAFLSLIAAKEEYREKVLRGEF